MYFNYTNGETRFIPDSCPYCNMNSGGGHELNCPNNRSQQIILDNVTVPIPQKKTKEELIKELIDLIEREIE